MRTQPRNAAGEEVEDGERNGLPQPAPGAERRARWWTRFSRHLELTRLDYRLLGALTFVALVLRFFSPIMPDFFAHPFTAFPISNCVSNTPIDTPGHTGTLCGLAYPYQKGTFDSSKHQYSPDAGEVFDEIYFGRFPYDDLKGISYFDDKPPVGKLIVAAGEWGWGWFRATFQGAHGSYADLGFTPFGWRLMPFVFGTLLVPLMYLLALRLWPNRLFAGMAAFFACFDGMFFVQSRIAMLDIFLAFFIVLAYWLFLLHLSSRTPNQGIATLFATGVALGLAIGTKWSGLAAWAALLLLLGAWLLRRSFNLALSSPRGFWLLRRDDLDARDEPAIPGGERPLIYAGAVLIAFLVVPLLIYTASWFPFFLRGQFHSLGDIVNHDYEAYLFNATLTATHPYGSPWFSWPVLYRPVLYYFQGDLGTDQWTRLGLDAAINNMGNPWIWWTSLPCLLALPYFVLRHRSWAALVIAVGFSTQYFPWSRVSRVLFLFEMGAMLPFMILALSFALTRIAQSELLLSLKDMRMRITGRHLVYAHLVVALIFFAYFYPFWTGLPISSDALLQPFPHGKVWFPSWI